MCECEPGYEGHECRGCSLGYRASFSREGQQLCEQIVSDCGSTCPQHWSREKCDCCPSGVMAADGQCCEMADWALIPPVLDARGKCCSDGFVDGCGVCGGRSVGVDKKGECCPVRLCSPLSCSACRLPCNSIAILRTQQFHWQQLSSLFFVHMTYRDHPGLLFGRWQ
jgi:hypothetical protein